MTKPKVSKYFDKQFGLYVKKKRLELQLSQADLASKVGNNYQNISRLERGEISPTLFWCYKLAEAFEIEIHDMIVEINYKQKK
ncbi:MAG: helix-turn-helix transcriptional regulator [Bacteroidetes bacterium]|nr:helix-turn-helix transcriptional regulator [Bacteroidota bacterium]